MLLESKKDSGKIEAFMRQKSISHECLPFFTLNQKCIPKVRVGVGVRVNVKVSVRIRFRVRVRVTVRVKVRVHRE